MIGSHIRLGLAAVMGVAALAFSGCSGGSSNATPGPCTTTNVVSLVYPAPSATGIPDNFQGVVFATHAGLPASAEALLQPAGSSTFSVLQFVATAPSPLPSPNQPPSYTAPVYQESASGGYILPAATQVAVYYNDTSNNCTPTLIGSFTAQ